MINWNIFLSDPMIRINKIKYKFLPKGNNANANQMENSEGQQATQDLGKVN